MLKSIFIFRTLTPNISIITGKKPAFDLNLTQDAIPQEGQMAGSSEAQEMTFAGKYTCTASNRGGSDSIYTEVVLRSDGVNGFSVLKIGVPVLVIVFICFVAFLSYHRYDIF